MIVCIDIGNTNLVFSFFEKEKIIKTIRKERKNFSISDLTFLLNKKNKRKEVKKIIIASVVPSLDLQVIEFCKKKITPHTKLLSVEEAIKVMPSKYKEHSNLGIDRILNSIAAYNKYKKNVIVIDFGTATTFDVVSEKGIYLGGLICFGIKTAANSLFKNTEKLPSINFDNLGKIKLIGKTTEESIKSGIVLGYAKLVDGLIQDIKKKTGESTKTIACGGLAKLITPFTKNIDIIENNLTVYALKLFV